MPTPLDGPAGGRAEGYDFLTDGCGNVLSQGIEVWISQTIIARAILADAL